jgi:hypothetical protein
MRLDMIIWFWGFLGLVAGSFVSIYLLDALEWDARPAAAAGVLVVLLAPLSITALVVGAVFVGCRFVVLGMVDLVRMIPRKPKLPRAETRRSR